MKSKLIILSLMFSISALAYQRVQGWCEKGAQKVTTSGLRSTSSVQGSFPACTVTVYVTGSGGAHATIYSDNSGTALANPFTADGDGHWLYYVDTGHYDTQFSGAGFPSPYTIGDMLSYADFMRFYRTGGTPSGVSLHGLPSSAPGAHCMLWINAGVVSITTCP